MDVRLYGRVISRYRLLVMAGLVLACVLTFLAIFRVGSDGVTWRQSKTYQATSRVLLTNLGGPGLDYGTVIAIDAEVGNSDAIRILAFGTKELRDGRYLVTPVSGSGEIGTLPILQIDGFASTPAQASRIAARVTEALKTYLPANVVGNRRVTFNSVSTPDDPVVSKGRRMTVPILIFLSVLIITLALVFLLENLKVRPPRLKRAPRSNTSPPARPRVPDLDSGELTEAQLLSSEAADDAGSPNGGEGEERSPSKRRPARRSV